MTKSNFLDSDELAGSSLVNKILVNNDLANSRQLNCMEINSSSAEKFLAEAENVMRSANSENNQNVDSRTMFKEISGSVASNDNSKESVLKLTDICKAYKDTKALKNVNLEMYAGQMLALLGHNGAGKTTLIKIILGIIKNDSGNATVLSNAPGKSNQTIGYVPENVNFYPTLTGYETLLYLARLNGLVKKDARKITLELLERVKLAEVKDRAVKEYSKGMKQRLGLAQALLPSSEDGITYFDPKLLILDEPTVGLDPIATASFYELLAQLREHGCGIIICTHVLPGLENYIDRALILNKGKVIATGSIQKLQAEANIPITIKSVGLNSQQFLDAELKCYLHADGVLKVPKEKKTEVLEVLFRKSFIENVDILSPSLPELYQHYVKTASNEAVQKSRGGENEK